MKSKQSEAGLLMWQHLSELRPYNFYMYEFKFCTTRRWKFDFAYVTPTKKIAIEIEGGAWISGRHNRGAGFIADMEKYNHAALLGWRVLRFTPQQVLNGSAIAFIERVLQS